MRIYKILLLIVLLPLAYWVFFWPHYSWHQKMTVEIEKDGKVYSGSSVTSVYWNRNIMHSLNMGPAWHSEIKGEAVVVQLPDEKNIFALLSNKRNSGYTANLAARILYKSKHGVWGRDKFRSVLISRAGPPLIVPPEKYPLLVTFKDINDPASVKRVDPNNLAAVFGPGFELKSITLEITDEPVTRGKIIKMLEWLKSIKGRIKPTDKKYVKDLTFEEKISPRDFIRN